MKRKYNEEMEECAIYSTIFFPSGGGVDVLERLPLI